MPRVDPHKLHGTYRTPTFCYGRRVECARRGEVVIVGLTAGRIAWPVGKKGRARSLVLYGDLAKAVRREANKTVCRLFGVCTATVWKWRQALGVAQNNPGTLRLRVAHGKSLAGRKAVDAMHAKARDPGRRAKIAAALNGRPRPPHVVKALRKANIGRKASKATRGKMSEAHKRRGTWPSAAGRPWQPWEDAIVRELAPTQAAKRLKRSAITIANRRRKLGLPDGRSRGERKRLGRK